MPQEGSNQHLSGRAATAQCHGACAENILIFVGVHRREGAALPTGAAVDRRQDARALSQHLERTHPPVLLTHQLFITHLPARIPTLIFNLRHLLESKSEDASYGSYISILDRIQF